MKTKEKILKKALEMLNNEGTERVTTRHIATALGISQGNLHYHYPTKNALIKALFGRMALEVMEAERFDGSEIGLSDLMASMEANFAIMYRYRFLFLDREVVWRRLPGIERISLSFIRRKKGQLASIVALLQARSIFRKDLSEGQVRSFVDSHVQLILSWPQYEPLADIPPGQSTASYFAGQLFRHWLPLLLPSEMKKWESVL